MPSRDFLCPRCGSPTREIVGKGETRCSECGLGGTFSSAIFSTGGAATPEQWAETDRWLRAKHLRDFDELARATFRAHGLDRRWSGLRWLGGWGSSNGVVTEIQLAHSNTIGDLADAQIRVHTRTPGSWVSPDLLWHETARHHVQELWRRTGKLSEDVRRAAFPLEPTSGVPTASWGEVILPIDEEPVTFGTLVDADFRVAQARRGETIVSIEAVAWPIERTGIVGISDLAEYESGSREIRTRWK